MNLKGRLLRAEATVRGAMGRFPWFDLEVWKREECEGLSLDEMEARRLAEYPEHAGEIRRYHALWRKRRAETDGVSDDVDTMEGETNDDGGDDDGQVR
ncbi:MAG TPA: hypothetical protein GX714_04030 [Chloroflexi bacterium]|jgi:hypothetical protein|nr:hypothetical protein [Chloroflexota bacterium]